MPLVRSWQEPESRSRYSHAAEKNPQRNNIRIICIIRRILFPFVPLTLPFLDNTPWRPQFQRTNFPRFFVQLIHYQGSLSRWIQYHDNPVLPDQEHSAEMGTMFDLSVLCDEGIWKIYGSWRPTSSIAYSTSIDGFLWDQNLQVSLAASDDHPWEQIINRPFVLKRAKGEYLMWY